MENRNTRPRQNNMNNQKKVKIKRKKPVVTKKIYLVYLFLFVVFSGIFIYKICIKKDIVLSEDETMVPLKYFSEGAQGNGATDEQTDLEEGYKKEIIKYMKVRNEVEVRNEALDGAELVMIIPKGEYVEAYGTEAGYTKLRYKEKVGYVYRDNLENIDDESMFKIVRGILVVNEKYSLPETYDPGLSTAAKIAFERMKEDAARQGLSIVSFKDYESYSFLKQSRLQDEIKNNGNEENEVRDGYNNETAQVENMYENVAEEVEEFVIPDGNNFYDDKKNTVEEKPVIGRLKNIEEIIELPGHSEHQTGLAFDLWDGINKLDENYEITHINSWLRENAYKFGFILRYPKDKISITKHDYEPWHYRYVGEDLAGKIFTSGLTVEEYFGIQ